MNRRRFLKKIPAAGVAAGGSATLITACRARNSGTCTLFSGRSGLDKVILAMLTIQRATWEQGVAMQALLEKGEKELVILMARDAVLRQAEDGRMAILGEQIPLADAASPGEAVLWAAGETDDSNLLQAHKRLLNYLLYKAPRSEDGIVYHFTHIPQFWNDSNYMLPPYLAAAGKYDEAVKQIEGLRTYLYNDEKKLFSHMWDCGKNEFARRDFWGVGNGWTAAGYARVINLLPASRAELKTRLVGYLNDLLEGCLTYLRGDGLFHNVIDDPGSFVETNLSQMLSYTIYTGIAHSWLDPSYKSSADKMRAAALAKVDEHGLVQGVCGSPDFDHPGTAAEGQAFHVLMETAHAALV